MIKLSHLLTISIVVLGQLIGFSQEAKPVILNIPEDWRYEKIDFPLDFAPEIPYEGFEELRFAPGMFDTSSPNYFTYVFAIAIDDKVKLPKKEIKKFLSKYYKGLSQVIASSKNITVDISEIKVMLKKEKEIPGVQSYIVEVTYLDTFNNGQKVLLHMELEVISNKEENKSYMLAIVSPQSKDSEVWKKLYSTRQKVRNQKILQ